MPHDVDALNAGFAGQLLEQYLEDPASVPEEWRALFERGDGTDFVRLQPGLARLLETHGNGSAAPAVEARTARPVEADEELLEGVAAAVALVKAYRMHGHLAARLDPLGSEPPGDPALEPERMVTKLTPELQQRIPASPLWTYVEGETLAEVLPRLRETYCGTIAYEIEHISDHEERVWLREAIESGRYRAPLDDDEERALLTRLTEVEGLETYLRKAFLGQKQFSIEGLDVLVPMLDEAINLAAEAGAHFGANLGGTEQRLEVWHSVPSSGLYSIVLTRQCQRDRRVSHGAGPAPVPRVGECVWHGWQRSLRLRGSGCDGTGGERSGC